MEQNRQLKIVFVIPGFGKGGAERALLDICEYLRNDTNILFKVACLYADNQNREMTRDLDITYLDYQTFSLRGKNENPVYKKLLQDFQPDIIHTHLFLAEFLSSYYADPGVAYVCHGHDNMIQLKKPDTGILISKKKLLFAIERSRLLKKYRKCRTWFIANSEHTFQYYRKNLPHHMHEDVKLIEYGFNYRKFASDNERSVSLSKKIKLINVGSFQLKKNQLFLVKIAAELRNRGIDFEINLLGDGEYSEAVQQEIRRLDLQQHVFLRGIIHDVENWYRDHDFYIHAATYEPFGLVFLEAMAAGLPVITLNGKGNESVIVHGKNGFIFDYQNEALFVDAIIELAQDPVKYSEISDYGKIFSAGYDVSVKCKELVEFYYAIVKEKETA